MEDEKLLKYGVHLMNDGNKDEATKVFTVLANSKDDGMKLQAYDALLSILDQIKDYKVIMILCNNGIKISQAQERRDNLAYFQIRKASAMSLKIGGWKYIRKMFKLSPDWFGFSTEEEQEKYKELDTKIEENEKQVDVLCSESLKNAELANNNKLLGMIYLYRSLIWKNRYSDLRVEQMTRTISFLPHGRFRDMMEYNKKDLRRIDNFDREAISDLKRAISIFKEIGDNDSTSNCLNNLANHYLHSYRYIEAFITLKKLEKSIMGTKDQELLRNFKMLKNRLFTWNKNIPNNFDEYKDYMAE
jgi:tetratricopeptide (TPR) repeat protein